MTYQVSWDGPSADNPDRGNEVNIDTVTELDRVLDRVAGQSVAENVPFAVQIHNPGVPGSVMIGIGHPRRSFVDWLVSSGQHEYGYLPDTEPPPEPIGFDVYGNWHEHPPEKLRLPPEVARSAVREYVRTGQRPTGVEWATE